MRASVSVRLRTRTNRTARATIGVSVYISILYRLYNIRVSQFRGTDSRTYTGQVVARFDDETAASLEKSFRYSRTAGPRAFDIRMTGSSPAVVVAAASVTSCSPSLSFAVKMIRVVA